MVVAVEAGRVTIWPDSVIVEAGRTVVVVTTAVVVDGGNANVVVRSDVCVVVTVTEVVSV